MEPARPRPARILAKALNCLNLGADGEPDGTCENCVAIAAGSFNDLVEMDAASNNGVDAIRDLVERVSLGIGATSKIKVYLVDEVHMLSNAASNALLKTLEEPPGHVVFVLATTNPEKVLPTIRSRTQHFELTLLSMEEITGLLGSILEREGVEFEPDALTPIARAAGGSARDAESLLDQALAHATGALTAAEVESGPRWLALRRPHGHPRRHRRRRRRRRAHRSRPAARVRPRRPAHRRGPAPLAARRVPPLGGAR